MLNAIRLAAIIALSLVAGAASLYFQVIPGTFLKGAFKGYDALTVQSRQRKQAFNRTVVHYADKNNSGITLWNKELSWNGYTVFASGYGKEIELIDMSGTPVHSWNVDYTKIWEPGGDVQELVPERFIFIRKAQVYPDGRLLVIFSAWATTPYGYGIAMLDHESKVLWKDFRAIHHSFSTETDGTIYALDHQVILPERLEDEAYLDNGVVIYQEDGSFVKRFSLYDAFRNSNYSYVLPYMIDENKGNRLGNYMHSNDVDVLHADMAANFPFAKAGDLLVSLREIDGIAIVDPAEEKVTWFVSGYWRRHHDPDFLPNGNMLILDNHAMRADAEGRRASRVIEFDPKTLEIVWEYPGDSSGRLFTLARGSQQRLPNGNTLITESGNSRLVEVTADGHIVWEYYNPARLGKDKSLTPAIFWGTRYSSAELPFLSLTPSE